MRRVAVRLAVFALVLAGAFGGAYAIGEQMSPVHPEPADHEMQQDMQHGTGETMP
ncbi:MAG: hypothetical protein Q7V88_00370 [Actinomycetota bacterium]|nr:hypothetical protein [Actinomycetota bacterium]